MREVKVMKARFLAGPCDGAETVFADPLPATVRARGPVEDLVAEVLGELALPLEPDAVAYHLVSVDEHGALYVAARHVQVPEHLNWDGVEEALRNAPSTTVEDT